MTSVAVSGLTKHFGAVTALDEVTFKAEQEILTLLGPSGCGKSTTLRCIAGLDSPEAGTIAIGGVVVADPKMRVSIPPERRGVGMVFQSYALWPHMTVFENIAYGLRRKRVPTEQIRKKIEEVLDLLQLAGLEKRYPSQLSGGQQQRVALGRSLAFEPKIILLDEPLSNLDAVLRQRTRSELKKLLKSLRLTSVYVTHDQEEAFIVSDQIAIMNHGKIVQDGSPEEIYDRPKTEFVCKFIGDSNIARGKVVEFNSNTTVVDIQGLGEVVVTQVSGDYRFSNGENCFVSFKPHDITISREKPANHVNLILGKILKKEFKGPVVDYGVEVQGKELIVSSQLRTLDVGEAVFLALDPGRVTLIATH